MPDTKPPEPHDPTTPPSSPLSSDISAKETETPTPGARWKGEFQIEEIVTRGSTTVAWRGVHIVSMDPVLVTRLSAGDPVREQVWGRLVKLRSMSRQAPRIAHVIGKHRYEVCDLGPRKTFREWRAHRAGLDPVALESLLRSLSVLFKELHGCGLGHFNLNPDTLMVDDSGKNPRFILGAWEHTTLLHQAEPIALPYDPFYVPPEAAGQTRHTPGEQLVGWDWWALGRLVQEAILDKHVLGFLLKREVNQTAAEHRNQAEALLQGRGPGGVRPGAVEAMTGLDPRTELLLHGLLTSNKDARWRCGEVSSWLDGASPRNYYSLGPREHCLRFNGEAYSVPDLVDALRSEQHWDMAGGQLLDGDQPGTLAALLHGHYASSLGARLDAAQSLLGEESLQEFPPEALREAAVAVALTGIAGGKMMLRGRRVDSESLREYLAQEDGTGLRLASLWALTSAPVTHLIDRTDRDAARALAELGKVANQALSKAWENDWLGRNDLAGIASIWSLACEPVAALQKICDGLHRTFACSTRPEVDAVFQPLRPPFTDLVLLAFMDGDRGRFAFLTHEELAQREYASLKTQGQQLARVIFWKRLYEALNLGPWLFGQLRWLFMGWLSIGLLLMVAFPGPLGAVFASVPLLLALCLRLGTGVHLRNRIARELEGAKPWRLLDSRSRCLAEIAGHPSAHRGSRELESQLGEINLEISTLVALKPLPPPVAAPRHFSSVAFLSAGSWCLVALLLAGTILQMRHTPPSIRGIRQSWSSTPIQEDPSEESAKLVKVPWPYRVPAEVGKVKPLERVEATDSQIEKAKRQGRALLSGYEPATINVPILVPVPMEAHYGFLIYDGRRDRIVGKSIVVLVYDPLPRSWLELDGTRVFALPR